MPFGKACVQIDVRGNEFAVHLPDCHGPFIEQTLFRAMALAEGFYREKSPYVGQINFTINVPGEILRLGKVFGQEDNNRLAFERGVEIAQTS